MKKTKLTRSLMAACSIVALTAVMYGCVHSGDDDPAEPMVEPMEPMPEPMPVAASGAIMLTAEQSAALLDVLPDTGDSVTLNVGADGVTRAGVTFTCVSDYDCTVTVSNSAGTIVAMWASQTRGDGTASAMAMGLEPPVDTFAELNGGSTDSIRVEVVGDGVDANTEEPEFTATELIGMGIGGPGVLNADKAGLRSDFQANGAALVGTAADPGDSPGLTMGTTITGAMDAIGASDDMGSAPDGWGMKTLFRDWGDTAGDGDGGFETAAIVVKNLGEGTPYPFDRKLAGKYAIPDAQSMFRLSIRADGTAATVTSLSTSVDIDSAVSPTNTMASMATSTQWANMVFDSDSLVGAQSQDTTVDSGETFMGMYFGAPGQFRCLAGNNENCGLARKADGTIGVHDTNTDPDEVGSIGRWSFTPADGAMITVPDQDWMAYGAWLTTPDAAAGDHRIGVFFNGMDVWTPATDALDAGTANGLRGTATYSGGATGVYVDGDDSGLFTADATLTANFDKASTGAKVVGTDYMISGRIDNFRGTDGVYLGDDTQADPNHPTAGNNDWVVELGSAAFDTGGSEGTIAATGTTGSADGVSWEGMWNGQLFGPSGTQTDPLEPSGVAGQFWAETDDLDATNNDDDVADNPVTAVVGAFGATKDE